MSRHRPGVLKSGRVIYRCLEGQAKYRPYAATGYGASGIKSEWSGVPVLQKPFQSRELAQAIDLAIQR